MLNADHLRAQMAKQGITQVELARRIGISQQNIARLASGKSYGSRHLHRIARELGTTPAYLAGETDDPAADAPPPPELSRDELAWVQYWRALDREGRDAMVRVVRLLVHDRVPDHVLDEVRG